MDPILQRHLPPDMHIDRGLPGIQPVSGPWLRIDEAYGAQMARREALLRDVPEQVLYLDPASRPAAEELLAEVLTLLPDLGFEVSETRVICPDGREVALSSGADPMGLLGHLLQNDFVLLDKRADEHVLTGAVLCFPASWRLLEKVGRPLTEIHIPVQDYTDDLARRVQRLLDGIQVGRPLWRYNQLWYEDPELFQPRSRSEPVRVGEGQRDGPYFRTERQTLFRLPITRTVVFAIHTYVLRREDVLTQV